VPYPERMTELVGGDFTYGTDVPNRTAGPSVVEHDFAVDDSSKSRSVDDACAAGRTISADGENPSAIDGIVDLSVRIVEGDSIDGGATVVCQRSGESVVGELQARRGNAGPGGERRIHGGPARDRAEAAVARLVDEKADRRAVVRLEPARRRSEEGKRFVPLANGYLGQLGRR
jgi:hypothetical protein